MELDDPHAAGYRLRKPHWNPQALGEALKQAGLPHVKLHEARHSFASYLAAGGIGLKDLTVILGNSSVTVSLDRYGHLFEAGKAETAGRINAWLEAADTQSRIAEIGRSVLG